VSTWWWDHSGGSPTGETQPPLPVEDLASHSAVEAAHGADYRSMYGNMSPGMNLCVV